LNILVACLFYALCPFVVEVTSKLPQDIPCRPGAATGLCDHVRHVPRNVVLACPQIDRDKKKECWFILRVCGKALVRRRKRFFMVAARHCQRSKAAPRQGVAWRK
jgi:hypothetical protein